MNIKIIVIIAVLLTMTSCLTTKCHGGIYCECKEFKEGEHYE